MNLSLRFGIALISAGVLGAQTPRVVEIRAGDGTVLKGTLWMAARPGPAALLLHQCDDRRTVWNPLGSRLAAHGVSALAIDYRGYGESGGTPHDKLTGAEAAKMQTEQWPADIDTAIAFLSRQPGVDRARLAAAGGSCGVHNAIQLAMRHKDVKALALLAGETNTAGRRFLAAPGALPVFTASAADDQYADYNAIMGWYAAQSKNAQSRLAQYPDGGHAAVVFGKHPGLADTIATWYAVILGAEGGTLPRTNGKPMPPEQVRVLDEIDRGGWAAVSARIKANPRTKLFPEHFANTLGYEHWAAKDFKGGLEIMKLNAQAYPESPNAQDSLGDLYLAVGDKPAALAAARRALELLKTDTADSPQRKETIRRAAEEKIKTLTARRAHRTTRAVFPRCESDP